MPPAPTKSGTPPNRTKDVVGYTTPHSSPKSRPEEESKEPPNKWDDGHDKDDPEVHTTDINQLLEESSPHTPNHSTGKGAPAKGILNLSGRGPHPALQSWSGNATHNNSSNNQLQFQINNNNITNNNPKHAHSMGGTNSTNTTNNKTALE